MSELLLHRLSKGNVELVKETVRMSMAYRFSEDKIKKVIHEAYAIEYTNRAMEEE